jgi:polyhydroxybutyrate depolymerase
VITPGRIVLVLLLAMAVGVGVSRAADADGGTDGGTDEIEVPVAAAQLGGPGVVAAEHTLVIGGVTRTYRSFVPSGAGAALPLIVVLHGRGQSVATVVRQTGFLPLVRQHRAALVFPDGISRSWNAGEGCCGVAGARGSPDAAFVTAVVAQSVHALPVDPSRVYLVGYSNGGKLAYAESCAHPHLFAALATYGSVPLTRCDAAPVPFLLAAGELDHVLPFGGAPRAHPALPPVRTAAAWLVDRDGCTAAPVTSTAGRATLERWTGCRDGIDVTLVVYPHEDHTWPGAPVVGDAASAAGLMWAFLGGHRAGPVT